MTDLKTVFDSVPTGDRDSDREVGVGLALSGGGFRAMLFHVGALRRLYEVDALPRIDRISSVSGGSIANAVLAQGWKRIHAPGATIADFEEVIQQRLLDFSSSKLDVSGGIRGVLRPGRSIAQTVARTYDEFLNGETLQDLPDRPQFVFCATNFGTGSLVRFSKRYTSDYRVGKRDNLALPLATAVAASAAFPPVLSPLVINLTDGQALTEVFPGDKPELAGNRAFTHRLELSDGGVYDNLGLQPLEKYHTLLVSDGGGPFQFEESGSTDWVRHMIRAWKVTDNQVRSLRRSALVDGFEAKERNGAFWGIQTVYRNYEERVLEIHPAWAGAMEAIPTRLWPMPVENRKQLINWSYALTDAALRSFVTPELPPPTWPFPEFSLEQAPPATEKKKPWWRPW